MTNVKEFDNVSKDLTFIILMTEKVPAINYTDVLIQDEVHVYTTPVIRNLMPIDQDSVILAPFNDINVSASRGRHTVVLTSVDDMNEYQIHTHRTDEPLTLSIIHDLRVIVVK